MGNRGALKRHKRKVIRYLSQTTLSFEEIGRIFGVSRQAVNQFTERYRIKRPPTPYVLRVAGHKVGTCDLCGKIIEVSRKVRSEFLTRKRVMRLVGLKPNIGGDRVRFGDHLRKLKKGGLVEKRFATIQKEKYSKAFRFYLETPISMSRIGRMTGIANFQSIRDRYRRKGFDLPPSKFVFEGENRRKAARLGYMSRRKRRRA
jgi:DNA-binding transcriptional ArsR family regulator